MHQDAIAKAKLAGEQHKKTLEDKEAASVLGKKDKAKCKHLIQFLSYIDSTSSTSGFYL